MLDNLNTIRYNRGKDNKQKENGYGQEEMVGAV
jgi:hypothetical protein